MLTKKLTKNKVIIGQKMLTVMWEDGFKSMFHYSWLRHNCPSSINDYSHTRAGSPLDYPADIRPLLVEITTNNQLEIVWNFGNHISKFELNWLREHSYSNKADHSEKWKPTLWDSSLKKSTCEFEYEAVFNSNEVMRDFLAAFKNYGFAIMLNVPTEPKIVLEIGKKLSYITYANWGSFYDVIAKEEKTPYMAYSSEAINPHADDLSFNPVPAVQILHCMINEAEGGESSLVDGFKIAATIKERNPEYYKLLTTLPLQYLSQFDGFPYQSEVPLIRLDTWGEVEQIYHANHTVQPFKFPADKMEAYFEAYRHFCELSESEEFQIRFRFKPGDFNMINNHRLLHGRKAFSASGARHLQGCYIAKDGLYSRLAMLNNALGIKE